MKRKKDNLLAGIFIFLVLFLILIVLLSTACTKPRSENWAATEYRIQGNNKWVSIHFHNLSPEDYRRFKAEEALGPHKLCPDDYALSLWIVKEDTCVNNSK